MTSPQDLGARDDAIAVNSYTTVLGRLSLDEPSFRAYWRDVHGPLCARLPGLGFYQQHHFARHSDAHLWPAIEGVAPLPGYGLDGAVEIGWASEEQQKRFQDASSILFGDEQNVFEETAAYTLPQGSRTLVDRQPDPTPNGPDRYDRLHVHLTPRAGHREELAAFVTGAFAEAALAAPGLVKLRVHLPEDHDNSSPNPPAPNVAHTVAPERVSLVILEVAFTDPLARRRFLQSDAFAQTTEAQAELASHITPFLVSGVHTYIRDEQLTTAGLRGGRAAELIERLAATNQVEDDVVRLMHTGDLASRV